jgi:hypothetical protein
VSAEILDVSWSEMRPGNSKFVIVHQYCIHFLFFILNFELTDFIFYLNVLHITSCETYLLIAGSAGLLVPKSSIMVSTCN